MAVVGRFATAPQSARRATGRSTRRRVEEDSLPLGEPRWWVVGGGAPPVQGNAVDFLGRHIVSDSNIWGKVIAQHHTSM